MSKYLSLKETGTSIEHNLFAPTIFKKNTWTKVNKSSKTGSV